MMLETLRGRLQPVQRLVQLPLAISIEQQNTTQDPFKSLHTYAQQLKRQYNLLSVSILLGFPYADVAEMGSAFILIAKENSPKALEQLTEVGQMLTDYVTQRRVAFNGEKTKIDDVIEQILNAPKPVLTLDMGDNVGGGRGRRQQHLSAGIFRAQKHRWRVRVPVRSRGGSGGSLPSAGGSF